MYTAPRSAAHPRWGAESGGKAHLLKLPPAEVRDRVDDDPRQTAAKVDDLVHDKGHDAGGEDVVLHPQVPGGPETFDDVELDIVLVDVVEHAEVGLGRGVVGEHDGRVPAVVCERVLNRVFADDLPERRHDIGWAPIAGERYQERYSGKKNKTESKTETE